MFYCFIYTQIWIKI